MPFKDRIDQFMWSYQQQFCWGMAYTAARLCETLGYAIEPEAFLVGILVDPDATEHPICIEPEDGPLTVSLLGDLPHRAEKLRAADPDSAMFHSHPVAQHWWEQAVSLKALRRAIVSALSETTGSEWTYLCGPPARVGIYEVFPILRVRSAELAGYHSLSHCSIEVHPRWHVEVPPSLLHAALLELLEAVPDGLRRPDAGAGLKSVYPTVGELAYRAGDSLMETVARLIGESIYVAGLFTTFNVAAASVYEGAPARGRVTLAKPGHPNVVQEVRLRVPARTRDAAAFRKLVEVASEHLSLLADGEAAYGFGRLDSESYDGTREDAFVVGLVGRDRWELSHAGRVLMRVESGVPRLPGEPISEAQVTETLDRLFPKVDTSDRAQVWSVIQSATRQPHGTTIVVTDHAEEEATRMQSQGALIEPTRVQPDAAQRLSGIDGALLVSPSGEVHALGVILDGLASAKGDARRGARYNSAVRYHDMVRSWGHRCLVVVVSVDGRVDLVPEFRARLARSAVAGAVEKLRALAQQEAPDADEYRELMNWLEAHRFYLNDNQCAMVNQAREDIEARCPLRPNELRIVREDLRPDDDFEESYILDQ